MTPNSFLFPTGLHSTFTSFCVELGLPTWARVGSYWWMRQLASGCTTGEYDFTPLEPSTLFEVGGIWQFPSLPWWDVDGPTLISVLGMQPLLLGIHEYNSNVTSKRQRLTDTADCFLISQDILGLTLKFRLIWNLQFLCFSLPSTGILGLYHQIHLNWIFKR